MQCVSRYLKAQGWGFAQGWCYALRVHVRACANACEFLKRGGRSWKTCDARSTQHIHTATRIKPHPPRKTHGGPQNPVRMDLRFPRRASVFVLVFPRMLARMFGDIAHPILVVVLCVRVGRARAVRASILRV